METSQHSPPSTPFSGLIRTREYLLDKALGTSPSETLNPVVPGSEPITLDPDHPGKEILTSILKFKATVISPSGAHIDYNALASDPAFIRYKEQIVPALIHFNPDSITNQDHRIAFWMNLYNALIIDAVITLKVNRSVTEKLGILTFFRRAAYTIGGQRISAEDMEHGLLRANKGNPYFPGPQFEKNDPRLNWTLETLDPRIHFGLNCASKSCPPIGIYSPEKLDHQLNLAANNFIRHETAIRPEHNEVRTSKIFQWYATDFGGRNGILDTLLSHLPESAARSWLKQNQSSVLLKYHRYDWRLNV